MSENFCPTCEDYRETRVEAREETYTVRGKPITVRTEVEVCPACKQTIHNEKLDAETMRRVYDGYRQGEGLLSPDEIKAVRTRYGLSQRSFAALLGMSQATINRYERGSLQVRAHDEAIRACRRPAHVQELLARRGDLLSVRQREQGKAEIEELLGGPDNVPTVPDDVASLGEDDLLAASLAVLARCWRARAASQGEDDVLAAVPDRPRGYGFVSGSDDRDEAIRPRRPSVVRPALAPDRAPPAEDQGTRARPAINMPREMSERTGYRLFSYERCAAVVAWLCHKLGTIPKTKLNKLLFYADFLSFRMQTVSLTGSAYRRLQHGPVHADYGGLFSQMERDELIAIEEVDYGDRITGEVVRAGPKASGLGLDFTAREIAVLGFVATKFGSWSARRIRDYSHAEAAFRNTPENGLISYREARTLSLSVPE